MSKSNAFETALLNHLFNNSAIANVGDATGLPAAATVGSLYLALHTADPGEAGAQNTSECAYTGYARKAIARNSGAFSVSGNAVNLVADQDFGECTAGTETATHWSIGTLASGAGMILYKGALSPTIAIAANVIPRVKAGTIVTED